MCRIQRDIGKEGLLRGTLRVHPLDGLGEEEVGAIALGLLPSPIVPQRGIDVCVSGGVAAGAGIGLSDASATVDIHFIKPAILWPIRRLIAEMPLAENPRSVADRLEHLRQREGLQVHAFTLQDGVRDAVLELMPPAHHGCASRRTRRAHMELREQHALLLERIHRRRAHDRVPKARIVAIARVIRHHEDNVWPCPRDRRGGWKGGIASRRHRHRGKDHGMRKPEHAQ